VAQKVNPDRLLATNEVIFFLSNDGVKEAPCNYQFVLKFYA